MMFRKRNRRDRQQVKKQRETRRRRLTRLMSRTPRVESPEARRLLAVVTYDALTKNLVLDGDADDVRIIGGTSTTILVGNSDTITLAADAVANANFVLSTTNTAGDTLTMDVTGSPISDLQINGGAGDDTLTIDLSGGPILVPIIFNEIGRVHV